ncbi:hypothetical protein JG687_00017171 [Phytophthora cactorum]|uniref:Uncharacterized protein n=1 Tax=Phytophthora cactorum TaxID=29920 RepID=A0A329T454_9STRA|nr:hypothetical protein Pcac1_g10523 [Phytophthora cactorum]KAG2796150.1 hypothetical protein PC112_g22328 [Phytophthora cactorum]KAG2796393.1 hypothetical protein PC111_g21747 [Phytophthora cactorum]KAG2823389.1 hypothetical protein PC113_g22194 [Phytophthora cactorum]KAG2875904.1 hypothetical protein PC114_g24476 [Phytophthora cactorum]
MDWWLLNCLGEWKVALLGENVSTVFVWMFTTPVRDMMLVFACRVYEHGANVVFFLYTYGERYMISARRSETLKLHPEDYACASGVADADGMSDVNGVDDVSTKGTMITDIGRSVNREGRV